MSLMLLFFYLKKNNNNNDDKKNQGKGKSKKSLGARQVICCVT